VATAGFTAAVVVVAGAVVGVVAVVDGWAPLRW